MVRDPLGEETGKKEPEVREEKSPHIRLSSHPGAHCICAHMHKMGPPLFSDGWDGGVMGPMRLMRPYHSLRAVNGCWGKVASSVATEKLPVFQ